MPTSREQRFTILVADDSDMNRNILRAMLEESYDIIEVEDGEQAVAVLQQKEQEISLLLLDLLMPNLDGFGVLTAMNQYSWIESIPVIMITAENTNSSMRRAYNMGVSDFISRPYDMMVVRRRVKNAIMLQAKQRRLQAMVNEQIYQKEKTNNLMISILSHIVEFRNEESGLHVLHIQTMTEILLKSLMHKTDKYKLDREIINLISNASTLHDVGKICIASEVLNKPGKFTAEEFAIMKTHSQLGAEMMKGVPFQDEPLVKYACEICRWHHERYDGRGYPDGLVGEEIPISAQVVSLADVYDALTSERVYKPAHSHEKALAMILNGECGVFQPLLLECLVESSDIIQQEMAVDAVVRGDQRIMENTAVEVFQHEELNTTDRTLRALEFERAKLRFFMSASQDILFECTKNPSVLTLCHAGTQRLGLEKDMVDPCHDPRVLKMIGMEHIQELARRLQSTTPEKPAVEYRCEVLLDGVMTPVRLMCQAMWSAEEPPQYAGVVGKMIEERREEERH
ncbi:response regulator [Pseudoflavonifractor sp. 60]|uniref:HD domain-containing phosphohydrolase n=1 Tax=Pseudoflavonifractor sp. 60 TaxID=2304576 RepID=UPI001369554D|nr:HD domain-containing phosphohydrolase [Pseudoflavonifractor sp. 60]NBI67669.1 response regulator [Pseudoflavonifractor sp. 60]